jgi:hypothetical protein
MGPYDVHIGQLAIMVTAPWGACCRDGKDMADNVLDNGDNRDIQRRDLKDEIVALVGHL